HHVAVSAGAGDIRVYLDGQLVGNAAAALPDLDGPLILGGASDGSGRLGVALDEVVLSTVTRSAEHIALAAAVQGPQNDRIVTYGPDESADSTAGNGAEGHAAGHFSIIFQNVFGNDDALVEQLV